MSLFYTTMVYIEITGIKQLFQLRSEFSKVMGFKVNI